MSNLSDLALSSPLGTRHRVFSGALSADVGKSFQATHHFLVAVQGSKVPGRMPPEIRLALVSASL